MQSRLAEGPSAPRHLRFRRTHGPACPCVNPRYSFRGQCTFLSTGLLPGSEVQGTDSEKGNLVARQRKESHSSSGSIHPQRPREKAATASIQKQIVLQHYKIFPEPSRPFPEPLFRVFPYQFGLRGISVISHHSHSHSHYSLSLTPSLSSFPLSLNRLTRGTHT